MRAIPSYNSMVVKVQVDRVHQRRIQQVWLHKHLGPAHSARFKPLAQAERLATLRTESRKLNRTITYCLCLYDRCFYLVPITLGSFWSKSASTASPARKRKSKPLLCTSDHDTCSCPISRHLHFVPRSLDIWFPLLELIYQEPPDLKPALLHSPAKRPPSQDLFSPDFDWSSILEPDPDIWCTHAPSSPSYCNNCALKVFKRLSLSSAVRFPRLPIINKTLEGTSKSGYEFERLPEFMMLKKGICQTGYSCTLESPV